MKIETEKQINYSLWLNITEDDRQQLTTEIDEAIEAWKVDPGKHGGLFLLPDLYNKLMEIGGE